VPPARPPALGRENCVNAATCVATANFRLGTQGWGHASSEEPMGRALGAERWPPNAVLARLRPQRVVRLDARSSLVQQTSRPPASRTTTTTITNFRLVLESENIVSGRRRPFQRQEAHHSRSKGARESISGLLARPTGQLDHFAAASSSCPLVFSLDLAKLSQAQVEGPPLIVYWQSAIGNLSWPCRRG